MSWHKTYDPETAAAARQMEQHSSSTCRMCGDSEVDACVVTLKSEHAAHSYLPQPYGHWAITSHVVKPKLTRSSNSPRLLNQPEALFTIIRIVAAGPADNTTSK